MPRVIPPLAIALAVALLSACGGHAHTSRGAREGAGAPATSAVTKAHALAFARAVNLTAADVPGFTASAQSGDRSRGSKRAEGDLFRCAGARPHGASAPSNDVATASSAHFELKRGIVELSVSSEVGIARSAATARGELAALHSDRLRTCFARYLDEVLSSGRPTGTHLGAVHIQSGSPPAPGAAGSFGWRVSASFGVGGVTVHVYLDLLGFVYGPARVTLLSSGALRPFPALAQQRLYEVLLARARAHAL